MAPATLSVHWVLAIFSKTHFAKDLLNRVTAACLTGQGLPTTVSDAESEDQVSDSALLSPAGSVQKPGAPALPTYLQSDA